MASEGKYTPWIVRGSEHHLPQVWSADGEVCITDRVFNDDNARLVAAAPDLFDACQLLVNAMVEMGEHHCREVGIASKAIRKAKGEN